MLGGLALDHGKQVWPVPFEMRVLEFPCLDALRLGMGAGEKIVDFVKAIHVELPNKTLPIVVLEVER